MENSKIANIVIIFGSMDPEAEEGMKVASDVGFTCIQLKLDGRGVRPNEAYGKVSSGQATGTPVALFECNPTDASDLNVVVRFDHHNPGDKGFGMPPEQYRAASSLGQLLSWLGLEPTNRQLTIMAGDHCLAAGYAGLCPGVSRESLLEVRLEEKSRFQRKPVEELRKEFFQALADTERLPVVTLGDHQAVLNTGYDSRMGAEVQAYAGLNMLYHMVEPDGRLKIGGMGRPEYVQYCKDVYFPMLRLADIYGDPARGFCGGYVAARTPPPPRV